MSAQPAQRSIALVLALLLGLLGAPLLAQTDVVPPAPPSANDLHEFTRLLSDPRIQGWIAGQAEEVAASAPAPAISLREELIAAVEHTRARMTELAAAWRVRPQIFSVFDEKWHASLSPPEQVRGLTFVMIFLFVGAGLEWLYRQYTNPVKLRIELYPVDTTRGRITSGSQRAMIAIGGLAVFVLGGIGTFSAFTWPATLETLVLNLLVVTISVRVILTLLVLFLAPRVQELRLLPLSNGMAKLLTTALLTLSTLLILAGSLSDVFERIAGGDTSRHVLAFDVVLSIFCLIASFLVIFLSFRQIAALQAAPIGRTQRRWRLYLLVLATAIFIAALLASEAILWTVILLGFLIPVLSMLRLWIDGIFDRVNAEAIGQSVDMIPVDPEAEIVAETGTPAQADGIAEEEDSIEENALPHPYESYRPLAQRIVQFVVLFGVGISIAALWEYHIFGPAPVAPTFLERVLGVIIDSAVSLLIADLVWVWASTAIDRRLDAYVPPEPGTAPGPEARMATLLPLLRVTLMVALLAMISMSILSALGVNIAPILAGAGVLGIAIGFGAQSLVKDVVSGIFFLIDDAFRVGEYVEIDQLRGTVERISIRSLQIRHHRGAVHTLPFGELRHLTNHSRDWVIMKLEFRVPFDTDLKLVKKLIKGIGAEMKQHPEYGDSILETLKSQGVRRMEEFNMVVGVKFMTRPGEQWLVRRDAYQAVRDVFDANGIRMAERNVKVEVANADELTPQEREAVAGAAQQAVERPAGPPVPIPDEP